MTLLRGPAASRPRNLQPRLGTTSAVLLAVCIALAAGCSKNSAPAQNAALLPDGAPWNAAEGFQFAGKHEKAVKARRSVSGIACAPRDGDRVCLFAFDEGTEGRFAVLRDGLVLPTSERVALLASGAELDAEAAATDGTYFYVTGSHSNKRKSCALNETSRHVVRFRVDPGTGRALRDAQGKLSGYADSMRLWELMSRHDMFKHHLGKCLGTEPPEDNPNLKGERGVNVEGLAAKDGKLFFGFRGPADDGAAPVLSVSADTLFSNGEASFTALKLAVGKGRGIRDLLAVKDGILVLAGPDDSPSQRPSYVLLFWDGSGAAGTTVETKMLAELDLSKVARRDCDTKGEIKPEALALLSESPQEYKVLVLSDGMCDGGALTFTIAR